MFAPSYSEKKMKVNLKLAIQRLKVAEKKKSEMALRSRKEIADYWPGSRDLEVLKDSQTTHKI